MTINQRKYERYEKKFDFKFDFSYEAATPMQFQVAGSPPAPKYSAVSRNIGAKGLCLTSYQRLEKGQKLNLELFLPRAAQPIQMEGEVCWCDPSQGAAKEGFDAGIELNTVEGQSVAESVYYDEEYQVMWSNVLESIFGTFRKLQQQARKVS